MQVKIRAFIAIVLPEKCISKAIQTNLKKEGVIEGNWTKDFHLTLKFLGEIDEKRIEEVSEVLKEICREFGKFKLSVSGIGAFPSEKFVRVLWAGFEESKELSNLQEKIEVGLEKLGFNREKNFAPHLTLCRVKKVLDKENLKKIFAEYKNKEFGSFEVSEILLMKSILTENGAVHEVLEKFCL